MIQAEAKFDERKYEKKTADFLKKEWFSGVRKPDELFEYKGERLPPSIAGNQNFKKILTYIYHLYDELASNKGDDLAEGIQDELFYFERQGKMCVHLSVITYQLMLHYGIANERSMRYVQGYYYHKAQPKDWISSMLGTEHAGSHAWLVIGKSVIDISIRQEELFFDFKGLPVILGVVPEGFLLKGFTELKKTVNKHTESFASFRKVSPNEWLDSHVAEADKIFAEML